MNLKDKFFLIIPMNKNNGVIRLLEITPLCLVVSKCCHRATPPYIEELLGCNYII